MNHTTDDGDFLDELTQEREAHRVTREERDQWERRCHAANLDMYAENKRAEKAEASVEGLKKHLGDACSRLQAERKRISTVLLKCYGFRESNGDPWVNTEMLEATVRELMYEEPTSKPKRCRVCMHEKDEVVHTREWLGRTGWHPYEPEPDHG